MNAPPRKRKVFGLGVLCLLMTVVLARKAYRSFFNPVPIWNTGAQQWHDQGLAALLYLSVAVACLTYLLRRLRCMRLGTVAAPRVWADRREVRVVFYLFAAVQIFQLPLAVYVTAKAIGDPATPQFANSIYSAFPASGMFCPLVGIAVVIYDRRRVTLENRRGGNLCLKCGYDLRATPDRCPECGAVPGAS